MLRHALYDTCFIQIKGPNFAICLTIIKEVPLKIKSEIIPMS